MMSMEQIIRAYSRGVESKHYDADLTPRQRRLVHVMLNLASNGWAHRTYAADDNLREDIIRKFTTSIADARWLVIAASPASDDDYSVALDRSLDILRNI